MGLRVRAVRKPVSVMSSKEATGAGRVRPSLCFAVSCSASKAARQKCRAACFWGEGFSEPPRMISVASAWIPCYNLGGSQR